MIIFIFVSLYKKFKIIDKNDGASKVIQHLQVGWTT